MALRILRQDSVLDLTCSSSVGARQTHDIGRSGPRWIGATIISQRSNGWYCVVGCAIFIRSFTLDTAVAIVEEEGMIQNDVAEAIESLVDKSMVEAAVDTHETSYRLLDTTRAYALEKLLHSGEHDALATRHANFLSKLLEEGSVDLFEIQSSAPGPGVASIHFS